MLLLNDNEKELVSNHLAHNLATHNNFYKLQAREQGKRLMARIFPEPRPGGAKAPPKPRPQMKERDEKKLRLLASRAPRKTKASLARDADEGVIA